MTRLVEIAPGLVLTAAVEKRLAREATSRVTRPFAMRIAELATACRWFLLPALIVAVYGFYNSQWWVAGFALFVLLAPLVGLAFEPAKSKYKQALADTLFGLATRRQQQVEERARFYQSAEWVALRAQVVNESGRSCAKCGRIIHAESELTVDHIKPRSLYPGLALVRSNLQVLCRSCNSRKGAKEPMGG